MTTLSKELRNKLEATVKQAREVAERAAQAALEHLGVGEGALPAHLNDVQKVLRRKLRAHGRALGDVKHGDDTQEIQHLVWETAYEHWHRMLFARFLAESNMLMYEVGAPVSLAECEELVQDPDTSLGAKSGWELAGILAARMLPQVFKPASPVFDLVFAPEQQRELEKLLAALSSEVFQASDSLGWVYQFWQAKRKDDVNASGVKIGADELPAVTQLFTEPYMVDFLLHNSLGAWWVTRHPELPSPVPLTYLRTLDDGKPAAGEYEGWPQSLKDFTLLDPCCGSGHFLVAAFLMLVPMRMASEGLSAAQAVDAVLADNLHGLELDARCVEIAVFALALTAWRFSDESGNPLGARASMPAPNIACCGLKVAAKVEAWQALVPVDAPNAEHLRQGLAHLHATFAQAPLLGSLLDPAKVNKGDLFAANYHQLSDLLAQALASENAAFVNEDEEYRELALSAQGLLQAARLLESRYHLVITNVPYKNLNELCDDLRIFCAKMYPEVKGDLANVFLERCIELTKSSCSVHVVMPQNWLFLTSYKVQRSKLLLKQKWDFLARLGPGAFETISGEVVKAILLMLTKTEPSNDGRFFSVDTSQAITPLEKAFELTNQAMKKHSQIQQMKHPDQRIVLDKIAGHKLLNNYAGSFVGLQNGDTPQYLFSFWEVEFSSSKKSDWVFFQMPCEDATLYQGRYGILRWENGNGSLQASTQARIQGCEAWNKQGILVRLTKPCPSAVYSGNLYDQSSAAIIPKDPSHLAAIYLFCQSIDFFEELEKIDQKRNVTNATFVKVPFDLDYWLKVADEIYPLGLPKPYSDDPTQWIFHGHPKPSTDPLQVAVARLLGYQWPAETDAQMDLSDEAHAWIAESKLLNAFADDDGIVCLPAVRGEKSAADRLLDLLIAAWGDAWHPDVLNKLLKEANCEGKGLEVWLRDYFFEQHCKRFGHRPFVWQVWDGLKDGFSVLLNYHQLNQKTLERLIHTYLGDWIAGLDTADKAGDTDAQRRLNAALELKSKLEKILAGEAPYDIFVRWKPLAEQAIGWNPDLNDGVRMNIRPWMTAEVLRHNKAPKLNVKWEKDRGTDVESAPWFHVFKGERINNHHLTLAEKLAAKK
ncbi:MULTISPECIES: N-6 DNA methylase [Deefgea]|uniref:site-specific DNA-methyltransferase (adenine-specific) n=1 Tax=Deefgea chitinilytica TaxID=570276 RepID=A0ABS2C8R6_9NEIS|nr:MULTISPECIES: N-6 DNA methylase [Deefgea]MBM5570542.1 N-6 DNA methylase [Deefgea chitinilytica]MBM9887771.1 N-6 DNA methylase [Deefgea sp. CFH1-16]